MKKKILTFGCFTIFCWLSVLSAADYRVFKSDGGVELEAEVVSCVVGESATIRRSDGRVFKDVPWSRFSMADRKYLGEWAEEEAKKFDQADLDPDARIKVSVLKGQDDDFNNYGDIDDRVVKFEPRVIIDSDEKDRTFTGVQGELLIIGQGYLKKDEYVLLQRQEFELDLPAREEVRWSGKSFKCGYDPDYGGYRYGGYLLVLKNRSGHIVFTKASKSHWERNARGVLDAKPKMAYDRNFSSEEPLGHFWKPPGKVDFPHILIFTTFSTLLL